MIAAHILTFDEEFVRDVPPAGLSTWRGRLAEQCHGSWSTELKGASVDHRMREAPAVEDGLLALADETDVELIVLGSHGRGGLVDRLLGAVTYKVAHRARRPVAIVPEEWELSSQSP